MLREKRTLGYNKSGVEGRIWKPQDAKKRTAPGGGGNSLTIEGLIILGYFTSKEACCVGGKTL